ncbi:flagellar basal body P-ring formation chaperone FlgA [sulfur-oxidizing endosymbiont of Gigantopelta aegis]|uniref:flagellar basal body P-ring formation chaperone FlgA n=1 Tax=sulfur-oxidizing endosymbiont of Gigantopelta aegis TaxID=2794934 RepID=UPI001BE44F88|nr:flagellar basal body P-ring formation chaperone FlgA [sulfur-oxidizing endosymbiont of Gigantopelta aegis]
MGLFIIALSYSPISLAAQNHSHQQIRQTAVDFVRSQIPDDVTIKSLTAGKIDARIRFKQCSEALEASSGQTKEIAKSWTVGVRCYGETPWSIYISVKAKLSRKMIVSKTTITRGELITNDKILLVEQEINHRNQKHFSDPKNVVGREARRSIRPNRVITSNLLQEPVLVHRRETVIIYAKSSKLQISMKGTALKNGRYNEMIKVRNSSSRKIIDALVIDRGIVAINF